MQKVLLAVLGKAEVSLESTLQCQSDAQREETEGAGQPPGQKMHLGFPIELARRDWQETAEMRIRR